MNDLREPLSLCQDLPPAQKTPAAWYGADLADRQSDWLFQLTPEELDEIHGALFQATESGLEIARLTQADFPLPTLGPRLVELREALLRGRGFGLLRGLPVARYSQRQAAAIFFGVGAYLGRPRSQNAQGHVLGHVRDLGVRSDNPDVRIYQTNERQTFHTDSTDIVGLLCLKDAKKGGHSVLVSAVTIFNEMRRRRPDLLLQLFEPVATDRRGEVPEGMKPFFQIPVFSWHEGFLSTIYQRQYIQSAQRFTDAPRLSQTQIEALDLFDDLANDPKLNLAMRLQPGDMQFVYNHSLLHDRTAFEDWPDPAERRHLLRLWLTAPGDRPLPEVYAQRFGSVEIGDRGGIVVPGTDLCVPLDSK